MSVSNIKKIVSFFDAKLSEKVELKKVIKNITWLVADNIVRLFVGTIVGIWMARYLGPDQFGTYNYALAFVALFGSLVALGLDNIVIREIVKNGDEKDAILGSAFFLKLISGMATFLVIVLLINNIESADFLTKIIVIIIAAGFIFNSFDVIAFWFQSEIRSKYVVYAKNSAYLFTNALKILLLLGHASLVSFAWVGLLEIAMGSFGLIIVYKFSREEIFKWKVNFIIIKKLLANSWPLIFSGLTVTIYMKIDQVMIGNMMVSREVGIYSVAVRLSEIWYFIPMAIAGSVFPAIVALRKINAKLYLERLQIFYDLMAWLAVLIAIPVAFFSKDIIYLAFGSQYIEAAPVLSVYVWAGIAVFLGIASEQFLLAENLVKISFIRTALGGLSNVLLNLYLIPRYGIIGSAWATLISYSVSTLAIVFDKRAIFNLKMFLSIFDVVRILKYTKKIILN